MNKTNTLNTDSDIHELEDKLAEILIDVTTFEKNEYILECIYSMPKGEWLTLLPLCQNFKAISKNITYIQNELDDSLQVTWLDYEESDYGSGYCTIIFFMESTMWCQAVIHNKALLFENRSILKE